MASATVAVTVRKESDSMISVWAGGQCISTIDLLSIDDLQRVFKLSAEGAKQMLAQIQAHHAQTGSYGWQFEE